MVNISIFVPFCSFIYSFTMKASPYLSIYTTQLFLSNLFHIGAPFSFSTHYFSTFSHPQISVFSFLFVISPSIFCFILPSNFFDSSSYMSSWPITILPPFSSSFPVPFYVSPPPLVFSLWNHLCHVSQLLPLSPKFHKIFSICRASSSFLLSYFHPPASSTAHSLIFSFLSLHLFTPEQGFWKRKYHTVAISSFPLSSLPLFLCFHPSISALCSSGRAVIMVERRREGGWCDYCLVGSQKNRSAQKYVVRERGTVSDIINTLETYSESARPRARSHVNTHACSCVQHTGVYTHCRCVHKNKPCLLT